MIKYAQVTYVSGAIYKVKFLGEELQSEMTYKKLATYIPTIGDMVAFLVDEKGNYLCLGKTN